MDTQTLAQNIIDDLLESVNFDEPDVPQGQDGGSPIAHVVAATELGEDHLITVRYASGRFFHVAVREVTPATVA